MPITAVTLSAFEKHVTDVSTSFWLTQKSYFPASCMYYNLCHCHSEYLLILMAHKENGGWKVTVWRSDLVFSNTTLSMMET